MRDGARISLVHREALVLVVAGAAEPLELLDDRRAVLLPPLPDLLDERLATEIVLGLALLGQLLLDLHLRGDAGVVGAEDPLRADSAHARAADQHVLDRPVQRMPHVQRAGHVRRRDRDRVVLLGHATGLGVEEPGLQPAREDP